MDVKPGDSVFHAGVNISGEYLVLDVRCGRKTTPFLSSLVPDEIGQNIMLFRLFFCRCFFVPDAVECVCAAKWYGIFQDLL